MSSLTCPHCRGLILLPLNAARPIGCPHCGGVLPAIHLTDPRWFYARGREKVGPLSWEDFRKLAETGALSVTDMVRAGNSPRWQRAGEIEGLFPTSATKVESAVVSQLDKAPETPATTAFESADVLRDASTAPKAPETPPPSDSSALSFGTPDIAPSDEAVVTRRLARCEGAAIPGYATVRELGRGGMGVVYEALQVSLNRTVALKVVLAGEHAGETRLNRFRLEAEAIARLRHPNLVQIYEVGEHNGLPFFSLEYVEGGSLAAMLRGEPQPAMKAARLAETIARAIHAAHQQGVVHRDLKPANILLTADGSPKVTDFGLAKVIGEDQGQTASGAILGTPSYMAPEQAMGRTKQVGPACDIYAIGVILYEMLTGRPPFKAETPMETMLQVASEEPAAPSLLQRKVPADLETVCLKCLEKEPSRRYRTAEDLADDLKRFVAGEPILAQPTSIGRRTLKWARRKPALAGLVLLSIVSVLAMLAGASFFTLRVARERDVAESERKRAEAKEREAERLRGMAEDARGHAEQQQALAEERKEEVQKQLLRVRRNLYLAQLWRVAGIMDREPAVARDLLEDTQLFPYDSRDFGWGLYHRLCDPKPPVSLQGHTLYVWSAVFSPDGKWIASGSGDKSVRVWDRLTGQTRFQMDHGSAVESVAWSPDGKWIASGGNKGVRLWNAANGQPGVAWNEGPDHIHAVRFNKDGSIVLAAGSSGLHAWTVATGKEVKRIPGPMVQAIAIDPDGSHVAVAGFEQLRVLNLATFEEQWSVKVRSVHVAFSPDGKWLASAAPDLAIRLFDPATGEPRKVFASPAPTRTIAFSPDSQALLSSDSEGVIRIWDLESGQERGRLVGHKTYVAGLAFDPHATMLASASGDNTVRLWEISPPRERAILRGHAGPVIRAIAFTPDSHSLISIGGDYTVRTWDVAAGTQRSVRPCEAPLALAIARDVRTFAVATQQTIKIWDWKGEKPLREIQTKDSVLRAIAFHPEGSQLVTAAIDPVARLWDVASGNEVRAFPGRSRLDSTAGFSPDGGTVATVRDDGTIQLWPMKGDGEPQILRGHVGEISCIAFSPDGKKLATGGNDRTLRLWELPSGRSLQVIPHPRRVRALAFTPDSTRVVTAAEDTTARFWTVATGESAGKCDSLSSWIMSLAVSPDGRTLGLGCQDGTVRLIDVATGVKRP